MYYPKDKNEFKELIKTVDNIKADAQSRIDNPTARAKKEEKPSKNKEEAPKQD